MIRDSDQYKYHLNTITIITVIFTLWIWLHGGRGIQMTSPARQSNHLGESRGGQCRVPSHKSLVFPLDLVQSNLSHSTI